MKKYGLTVLVLTAAMTLGAGGISAMAAEGWRQENSNWVYYNAAGYKMYNVWRQGADGYWRYLDGNGNMAVNAWVDNDDYYVDQNGIMVANKWLQVPNGNEANSYDWYYFSSTGKCVKDRWEKINNQWYHFDDTGMMETGWILDDMYYCGDNGVMLTGWQQLIPPDGIDEDEFDGPYDYNENSGKNWYYFGTNGKKVLPDDDDDNFKQKKINGVYYCLDENGAMQTGWTCVTGDDSENIEEYRYIDPNGQVRVGWYSVEPPSDLQSQYDYDVEWFYFNNKGVPEVGPEKGSATTSDLKKINGNTYLFGPNGVPMFGLQKVYIGNSDEYTAYYFGTRAQSSMLTGKQRIDEGGVSTQYYFTNTGRGYTGVNDNYLYYMGKLQKAESGTKYEVISIPDGNSYKNYVVNTSGRIAKNTTVKDSDGVKYKTNSGGILIREDDEEVDGGVYRSPEEPDWEADFY